MAIEEKLTKTYDTHQREEEVEKLKLLRQIEADRKKQVRLILNN